MLVLDLDGVVLLGHPEGGRWDKHLARDLGIEPASLQEHFFTPHFRQIVTGREDLIERLSACWPDLACSSRPQELVDYWFAKDSLIDFDVLRLVDDWRASGREAFLATVQEHQRARYIWDTLGLSQHFDGLAYSADLGAMKPDAEFFRRVQQRLPCRSPDDVLFLDDRLENVEAALGHGWRARHYRSIDDLRAGLSEAG